MAISDELYALAEEIRKNAERAQTPEAEQMLEYYAQRIESLASVVEDMEIDLANYYERGGL